MKKLLNSDLVYLKANSAIEPLFDNWYAWSHLINPATSSLNIKNRHLAIMESYIDSPEIHMYAVQNPKMLGGPFIDYDKSEVDAVKALRDNTIIVCKDLLSLGEKIQQLNDLLEKEAKGYAMKPLYKKVPESLKGLVELFYDLNNNPSFRFYEGLLYKSKYYNESLQSINLFTVNSDDSRPFVLSTPSLPKETVLRFNIPFRSTKIDSLFETSYRAKKLGDLKKEFEIEKNNENLFESFFTVEAPRKYQRYSGDGVLTRYFGHACVLIETKEISILVDPVISYGYESDLSRYTYSDLPEFIDYVIITHNHQDHVLFETLLQIRYKIGHLIVPKSNGGSLQDPNLKLMFENIGFENVVELGEMETYNASNCSIIGIPFMGEHSDLNIHSKLCYLINLNNNLKVLFAADSCNIEPQVYQRIFNIYGEIDVVFLGMECDGAPLSWLYGPLLPKPLERDKDGERRLAGCDFEESKTLIDIFKPKNVFVYAMGLEPWLKYISSISYTEESRPIIESNKFLEYCRDIGIESERLFGEKIIEYK